MPTPARQHDAPAAPPLPSELLAFVEALAAADADADYAAAMAAETQETRP